MTYLISGIGLIFLLLGSNYLIKNIVLLAKKINVSQFIIASCTIALGTTMPELTTSLKSILSNPPHPGIAVGNLIGSNIANILLIIGIAAIIYPISINMKKIINLEIFISFAIILFPASIIFINLSKDITFCLSILIFVLFIYLIYKRINSENNNDQNIKIIDQSTSFILMKILVSIIGLIIGSKFLIDGSVQIAQQFGVSERVIGLSLLAIGTSLPELSTAIMASIKKIHGVALGNVLGANTYNILGILSIVEIIEPSSIFCVEILLSATSTVITVPSAIFADVIAPSSI